MILLLAEVENIYQHNSELALASIVFRKYVQTALLPEGPEESREVLFLCLLLIALISGYVAPFPKLMLRKLTWKQKK